MCYLTLHFCQWCLRTRALYSKIQPASKLAQFAAMAFDVNKKETQEGDDMVDEYVHKPRVTWMTRPKAARLEELRKRLRQVKMEMFRTEDVAQKKESV